MLRSILKASTKWAPFFVVGIAFFLRAFRLDLFPINHDEAAWTLGSFNNFDKFMGIPVSCFHGYIQPFYSCLVLLSKKLFSQPEIFIRFPAAVIGSATVGLLYKLTKEMYGFSAGLISALLLCFLPWHIIESRAGVSLILTPFFACLVFLCLVNAIKNKSNAWFLRSYLFLGIGSFYTYQNSILLVFIFHGMLIFLKGELRWLRPKVIIIGVAIFFIILFPLLYLQITGQISQYLGKVYRMYYQDPDFTGPAYQLFVKAFINLKNNIIYFSSNLFFTHGFIEYGQALKSPLLVNCICFPMFIISFIAAVIRRNVWDRLILVWLLLGYFGSLAGVRGGCARYIIISLPVFLIFIGKLMSWLLGNRDRMAYFKNRLLFLGGIVLIIILLSNAIQQIVSYYYKAPYDLEECRHNSYGCKEAALYLSQIPNIKNYIVQPDSSMEPLGVYLNYYLHEPLIGGQRHRYLEKKGAIFFVVWAISSHPEDYRGGEFSWLYKFLQKEYPQAKLVKTIFYSNGREAIHIYYVDNFLGFY
ncbi:MAG: glycosyltransferase family 39 protein [Candidatus Omnitrophota bacterium]